MGIEARRVGHLPVDKESHLVLAHRNFDGADFRGRRLSQFSSEGCIFKNCRFDQSEIDSASFGSGRAISEYRKCSFDGAKLSMGPGGYARFVDCSFDGTAIDGWFCYAVEIVNCFFTGRLRKAVFNGTVPVEKQTVVHRRFNEFEANDFARADLIDVGFRTGVDLSKQRLPGGDEYTYLGDARAAIGRARIALESWGDPQLKKLASGFLAGIEEDVQAGQRQLLIRVNDYPNRQRAGIRALLSAAVSD